eukprot:TRINITY_DN50482_c0_g1_i1.p1 TRINITY_DN50482_c0_g1~~TRINITY_DN50482_c0_g1_i1.p1  ORF type:complete len:116 (-),score=5.12 TRINITY_DN50482_c0_g1_i1:15-314(-)
MPDEFEPPKATDSACFHTPERLPTMVPGTSSDDRNKHLRAKRTAHKPGLVCTSPTTPGRFTKIVQENELARHTNNALATPPLRRAQGRLVFEAIAMRCR